VSRTDDARAFGLRAVRLATAVKEVVNRHGNVGTAFPGLSICGVCRRGHDRGKGIYPHETECAIEQLEKALAAFGDTARSPSTTDRTGT
jgi:hypothetical protein